MPHFDPILCKKGVALNTNLYYTWIYFLLLLKCAMKCAIKLCCVVEDYIASTTTSK